MKFLAEPKPVLSFLPAPDLAAGFERRADCARLTPSRPRPANAKQLAPAHSVTSGAGLSGNRKHRRLRWSAISGGHMPALRDSATVRRAGIARRITD